MSVNPNPSAASAATTKIGGPGGSADRMLARLTAPAALAGGGLLVVTQFVQLARIDRDDKLAMLNDSVYIVNAIVQFVVFWFLIVFLIAAHQRQAQAAGTLGVVGVLAASVGTLNLAGNYWFEAFVTPFLADALPGYVDVEPSGVILIGGLTSYLLFAIGWVIFGVACLRARVFSTGISIALIIGSVLAVQMVQPPLGVPLGLALIWLGVRAR
jgi:hypothetical protein